MAYYRFFIPDFMPKDLKVCLYLDVDMLALQDLRGLFALDLSNKVVGVIRHYLTIDGLYAKNPKNENFYFTDFYFCSGLLLINLNEWNRYNITTKALDFANKYEVIYGDQDALCAIIQENQALTLPYSYGIYISIDDNGNLWNRHQFIQRHFYTREQRKIAYANPVIWHYLMPGFKPWEKVDVGTDTMGKNFALYWWQIAWNVPYFSDELKAIFAIKRDNYLVCKDFGIYVANLINKCSQSFVGYLKMPFIVWNAFKEFDLNRNYMIDLRESSESLDRNLAFELLSVAARAWSKKSNFERIFKFIILPLRIYHAKKHCKKRNL